MQKKTRVGVLVSDRGTNLQSIINACRDKSFPVQIAIVISNVSSAYALKRAKVAGIPTAVVDHNKFASRSGFEGAIIQHLKKAKIDLLCLAGFMRVLSPKLVGAFKNKIMNIHPALLPSFPGLHAQRQALEHGVKVSGVTVHFVDEGTDTGPIILQHPVPVMDDDTEEALSKRILKWEHKLYVDAVRLFVDGKLKVEGRRVLHV